MNLTFILLAFFISFSLHAQNFEEHLSLPEKLLKLSSKAELDLVDFEMFPGGSFAEGYEFEVEPAFTKGLYSRRDTWQVSLKAGASIKPPYFDSLSYMEFTHSQFQYLGVNLEKKKEFASKF